MQVMIGACGLFIVLCVHSIFGCSSTSASKMNEQQAAAKAAVQKTAPVEQDHDTIINWQNKGFGAALPEWLVHALSGEYKPLRKQYPSADASTIILVHADGTDLDLAEQQAAGFDVQAHVPSAENVASLDATWIQIHPAEKKQEPDFYKAVQLYTAAPGNYEPVVLVVPASK